MIAAVLTVAALLLWRPGPARRRRRRLLTPRPRRAPDLPLTAAILTPLLALLLFGPLAMIVTAAAAPLVRRRVASLGSAADHRRAQALVGQAPLALELIATTLESGRPASEAVRLVGLRLTAPLGDELTALAHRVRLAPDTAAAWRTLDGGPLEPLGRAVARSEASGAAITGQIRDAAQDLRQRAQAAQRDLVARVGVRTAAPLGLCLLPAFVLIGVAPTVIAVVQTSLG